MTTTNSTHSTHSTHSNTLFVNKERRAALLLEFVQEGKAPVPAFGWYAFEERMTPMPKEFGEVSTLTEEFSYSCDVLELTGRYARSSSMYKTYIDVRDEYDLFEEDGLPSERIFATWCPF